MRSTLGLSFAFWLKDTYALISCPKLIHNYLVIHQAVSYPGFRSIKDAQDPCSCYVCIYLKSMHGLQRLRTTTNETFINTFFKVICISNYTLLFSALNPVRWNVANCHNYIHGFE